MKTYPWDSLPFPQQHLEAIRDAQQTAATRTLQRNECSRFHVFAEASTSRRAFNAENGRIGIGTGEFLAKDEPLFVVRHDWAAVLSGHADGADEGSPPMPADRCIFEFRIRGRTVIVWVSALASDSVAGQDDDWDGVAGSIVWETASGLWVQSSTLAAEAWPWISKQLRAIAIVLDAQVVVSTPVPPPPALNKKRGKAGKPLLNAYHVIDLPARHRSSGRGDGAETLKRLRMHFRRGHWRRVEGESKTWVRWCLVGDPDLGWVDKEYRI